MSNTYNDILLEKAHDRVEFAQTALESEWLDTTPGKVLDVKIAQVIKHIETGNLEDLANVSLPALESYLAELSQAHFHLNNILEAEDTY